MIESIQIAEIATYSTTPEVIDNLSKFNFFFGGNATGKTTVSRVIANEDAYLKCTVKWKGGTKLETMVYNQDFIDTNFNQNKELNGIFTLGKKDVDNIEKIAKAKNDLNDITKNIEMLNNTLGGIDGKGGNIGDLAALENDLKDKCWRQKQKHDEKLWGAFEGYRGSAEKFKIKVLQERDTNSSTVKELSDLEKRAATLFGHTPTEEKLISIPDMDTVLGHENAPILRKRVIGKEDVDIAAMIKKIGNSDWVKEGRVFYEINEGVCPFCQQTTTEAFANSLNEYFDEAFQADSKAINDLFNSYTTDSERLQQQLVTIIADPSKFLDVETLKLEKELLDSALMSNLQKIRSKKREPSLVVELQSIRNVITKIRELLNSAISSITQHNTMVANLVQERKDLTAEVWKYLLEIELKTDLDGYQKNLNRLNLANANLKEKITNAEKERKLKVLEIRDLEKQTTSVQPTIDGINAILANFGFQSFSLAKSTIDERYKLVRADGTEAKATLSEGEKNFVTFLYFYHLLKGSILESGTTADRVVVIDDPVSSLDSDILFIVSSLIKGLFNEVREGVGYVKQIFVLTHNVYFHKEVAFNIKRTSGVMKEETFWVIKKSGSLSKIVRHDCNPIRTSYELLWSEVKTPDRSNLTIQNTLRRILENYFKILGGCDPRKICEKFDGNERLICNSLFSWVNEGSHYAFDDLYLSVDETLVETYLRVFKSIFEKSGHITHYDMMMSCA